VTHLRKIMLEELHRRNYGKTAIDCYVRTVEHFSWYWHRPPNSWVHNTCASTKPHCPRRSGSWRRTQ
jgi:hypothetical protein